MWCGSAESVTQCNFDFVTFEPVPTGHMQDRVLVEDQIQYQRGWIGLRPDGEIDSIRRDPVD